jgi:hypothetical protein
MTKKLYSSVTYRCKPALRASSSFRKFIMDSADHCLISALILRGCLRNGRYVAQDKNGKPVMDFISYRDAKGLISFIPPNREQKFNDNGSWSTDGRQTMKPAKFARAILHPRLVKKLKDHQFAEFANKFKANEIANEVTFHIESIRAGYNSDFSGGIGSCMHYKPVHTFYEMFDCNALIARKNGKNVGRAILWNDVTINDKEHCKFLDRMYVCETEIWQLFADWASDNGVYRKSSQNGDNMESLISPDGDEIDDPTILTYKKNKAKKKIFKPYLDTLEYTDNTYSVLSNKFRVKNKPVFWLMKSADNYRENQGHLVSAVFNDGPEHFCNRNQCIKYKNLYYYRGDRNVVECVDDYKRYHKDDKRLLQYNGRYYLKERRVVIGDTLYRKTDARLIKQKNNKWALKPVEPVIEKIEEPKTISIIDNNVSTGLLGVLQQWAETLNMSSFASQWTNNPTNSLFNYDYLTYGGGQAILTPTENQ